MKCFRLAILMGALAAASPAVAQSGGKYAVGMKFTSHMPVGENTDSKLGPGFLWRIGHPKTGWGFDWGLNWFSTNLDRDFGGTKVELGRLSVKPVMAGYGYTRVMGATSVSGNFLVGYAFNSLSHTDSAAISFRRQLGVTSVNSHTTNTVVARPGVSFWRDLSEKVGLNVSAGYMIARPNVLVQTTLGDDKRRVRADMFSVRFGFVYSVY